MGGMEAVMYSLADKLSKGGFEVLVAADKPLGRADSFNFFSVNVPRFLRSETKRLLLRLRRFNPHMTICDSWKSVAAVPHSSGRLIVLAHGQEYLEPSNSKKAAIQKLLERADLIVASSEMTANLVKKLTPDKQIEVIFPTYMLDAANPEQTYAKRDGITQILSLCRIEERKGLFQSAEALNELCQEGFEFHWQVAGSGPDLPRLQEYVANKPIAKHTTFLGRVTEPQKEQLLRNASLFLMPSYQAGKSLEGFGISYTEAAKWGVPSIAGNVGGAPEAVLDGQTGWCIDGSNPQAIAEALREALSDHQKLVARGCEAKARFNIELAGDVTFARLLRLSQLDVSS